MNRLTENLTKAAREFMLGRGYRKPLSVSQLLKRLNLPLQHQATLQSALDSLVTEGLLVEKGKRYDLRPPEDDLVTGVIRMHPRGFGFVQPGADSIYTQDIFIPKHLTKQAVDGDVVEAIVSSDSVSDKGPEGKVISIIERSRTHISGIIRTVESDGDALAYVPLLGTKRRVVVEPTEELTFQVGDRIVMKVLDWGSDQTATVCQYSHSLGNISDASVDVAAAIEQFDLRSDFPIPVIKEAQEFGATVTKADIKGREDFRDLICVTIDPTTAKDFDDALTVVKTKNGFHLRVHIADVSHYVQPESALDEEAKMRCNSTYFPGVCVPMLPPALSENLCSLKPNVNRLTASIIMEFDKAGELINYKIARGVIKSAKRFTYREAMEVLDGKKKSPHKQMLDEMVELCLLLKKKRSERGSIEFSLPEVRIQIDEQGNPYGTETISYDITHQMVEEFMLKANEMVAWHLSNEGKHITYRIHEEPSQEDMKGFISTARSFGLAVPDKPTPEELQGVFEKALNTSYGPYLSTAFIRSMRMASYSPDNIGHFGLSLTHYCHFTSPIRRYVDLVVHRILFGRDKDYDAVRAIALKCSEQERVSSRAESSVLVLKKLRYLKHLQKEDSFRQWNAVVTQVKPFGFFFEVMDLLLEGFIHVSEIGDDYYEYNEKRLCLEGKRKGAAYRSGDPVTVGLKNMDLITLQTDWYLV